MNQLQSEHGEDLMVFLQKYSLPKINDGTYVINLDKYNSVGTH